MLDYSGKRVLIVGGATGMGASAAKSAKALGAEITVLDIADVDYPATLFIQVNLSDKSSVDAALDRLKGPFHAIYSCAGVADGTPNIMLINFISQRYLIERLIAKGDLAPGAGIVMISSTAGDAYAWKQDQPLARLKEFLAIPDWEDQARWVENQTSDDYMASANTYMFSKRAVSAYVATRACEFLKAGFRINAIQPGPTDTALARASAWLEHGTDYRDAVGIDALKAEEISNVIVFICSPLASGITGENLVVDHGRSISQAIASFTS